MSGCVNNCLSCNSANLFLHAFLCLDRWFFWQSTVQYFTRLHAQFFNLTSSTAATPQEAHTSSAASNSSTLSRWFFHVRERPHVRGESGKKSEVSSSDLEKKITKYHDNCCYYVNHCNLVNTKNLRLCHSTYFISTFALTIRMISLLPTCKIMLSKPNKMALWCSLSSNQCAIGPTAS